MDNGPACRNCCHYENETDSAGLLFLGQLFGGVVAVFALGSLLVLGAFDANLNAARVFALVFAYLFASGLAVVCFVIDACELSAKITVVAETTLSRAEDQDDVSGDTIQRPKD